MARRAARIQRSPLKAYLTLKDLRGLLDTFSSQRQAALKIRTAIGRSLAAAPELSALLRRPNQSMLRHLPLVMAHPARSVQQIQTSEAFLPSVHALMSSVPGSAGLNEAARQAGYTSYVKKTHVAQR